MTTLPTPETLRSRAAVALACAESATNTGRFTTDAARILTETQRAVALTAYARELLTIAAQLDPAPSTATPAEVSPPDDHEPARGDVYEYAEAHYTVEGEWPDGRVAFVLVGHRPASPNHPAPRESWSVPHDFVRRFCRRVSPPREATEHPRVGDVYRDAHRDEGDDRAWVVRRVDADDIHLAATDAGGSGWTVSPDFLSANFTRVPS